MRAAVLLVLAGVLLASCGPLGVAGDVAVGTAQLGLGAVDAAL